MVLAGCRLGGVVLQVGVGGGSGAATSAAYSSLSLGVVATVGSTTVPRSTTTTPVVLRASS